MPFSTSVIDRERDKFVENPAGQTSVRVLVSNEAGQEIPISGTFTATTGAPTGPFKITSATVTDVSSNPIIVPLSNRVAFSIRNKSQTTTVYVGTTSAVTADDVNGTCGWELGPGEDLQWDLDDGNLFHVIAPAGETAVIKILEIASTTSGGGPSTLIAIHEELTGLVDGVNDTFTCSQIPDGAAFLLFIDGILRTPVTDFVRVGATVTTTVPPSIGQTVEAFYWY